ncbi:MAG: NAD-dependent epimerase/dehydratase family protein [Solirubrobacterales bacterium]
MALTVAVTGPTGEIGKPLLSALERSEAVERVLGMARRPFDPRAEGWEKVSYRQGDILDRTALDQLLDGADVAVHLAFVIFGSHEETGKVNIEGSRNVFEAVRDAETPRLVYTSSVAAYGFHGDNPQPLTEDVPPRGSEGFYYSAQKAELEALLERELLGSATEAYVFRPSIVAGRRATMLVEQAVKQVRIGGRLPVVERAMELLPSLPFLRPVLPDTGVPFQLCHHDDVASALEAAIVGRGRPGVYNLAGEGEITLADMARALGWYSVPVPAPAVGVAGGLAGRLSFLSAELEWVNALRVPVLMDTSKARRELGWEPLTDAGQTLLETVEGAQATGILG